MDFDPLQWELDQLDKLKKLAEAYGWDEGDKQYNSRVKLIQKQSIARQKGHALTQGVAGVFSVEPAAKDSKIAQLTKSSAQVNRLGRR